MSAMIEIDEKKRTNAAKRRATKARNFPDNTCPASRHAHLMADALADGKQYHMFTEEPLHCAQTLYSVLTSLWEARNRLTKLEGNWYYPTPAERKMIRKALAGKFDETSAS